MDSIDRNKQRIVRCPNCGGDSVYAASNPARPFCSERCKNMDFGAWASENFRVPTAPSQDSQDLDDSDLHQGQSSHLM